MKPRAVIDGMRRTIFEGVVLMWKTVIRFCLTEAIAYHVLLTAVMIGIGWTLLGPGDTLHSSPSYIWFLNNGPKDETDWGLIFMGCGMVGLMGIVSPNRYIKWLSATVLGLGHCVFAEGTYLSNQWGTGPKTYWCLAAASLWLIIKIGWEEKR